MKPQVLVILLVAVVASAQIAERGTFPQHEETRRAPLISFPMPIPAFGREGLVGTIAGGMTYTLLSVFPKLSPSFKANAARLVKSVTQTAVEVMYNMVRYKTIEQMIAGLDRVITFFGMLPIIREHSRNTYRVPRADSFSLPSLSKLPFNLEGLSALLA